MADLKFQITEHIALLSESNKGWRKEFNKVSWNERDPKYDIREWSPDYEKMGKGITFTNEEIKNLRNAFKNFDLE
ncbi:MAG: hypothetical protein ATN35_10625 [Epulopiscium sp. Nele67-Bin004]|nr:MAG: hypothetical protein ATN35_10625 [Epulopiscium sp. Nele67-Bin004]